MSWLSNLTPPGIKNIFKRTDDAGDTLWEKCAGCGEMLFHRDLEAAHFVCPACGHHMKLPIEDRLSMVFDGGSYTEIDLPEPVADPLKFKDERKYVDRLRDSRKKTGRQDAMIVATGKIDNVETVVSVQNFDFMGGSMGMALGDALLTAAEKAIELRAPLVVFTASGGARMQEGILSLMQMPRTTIAVQMMRDAKLPYLVVLTHPTTGGVTASYAMLGDVHLAEPGALIGFAGPRVIEQTIREKLPEGFQRSEFLEANGMVDLVVQRRDLKATISRLARVLMNNHARQAEAPSAPVAVNENELPPADESIVVEVVEDAAKAKKAKLDTKAKQPETLDKAAE